MEEKHPQTIAAVGEFELPEQVLQHIQSLMSDQREAARTTLVSKSWYGAWSTRPNLSFHLNVLGNSLQYARKTLQRYEDLNLNIKTFSLRIYKDDRLTRELILKAIKLGAVDLTIDIEYSRTLSAFVLPDEVLESETLARLSVRRVAVDLERRNKPLTSSNLKSLALYSTVPKGDCSYNLSRIFPLLEELTVEGCYDPCPFHTCTTKLDKLKFLQLKHLNTKDSFSESELWLQFPCLKTLVIWECYFEVKGEDVIRIRSPSLECLTISLIRFTNVELEFDVPNIRKFEFKGYDVPRLELQTSSREWESDIRITCTSCSVLCLHSLKQFVKQLSPSRVSLALCRTLSSYPQLGVEDGFVGDGLVENLTISGFKVLSLAILNDLFWSCRPNFVNIERRCLKGIQKENVEQYQHLSSLPWNTLLDNSTNHSEQEFVRFQLK